MKKILFVTIALGLGTLFSCKSENNTQQTETNLEQNDSLQTDLNSRDTIKEKIITVPNFDNKEAANFAKKYNDYVIELKAAAGENQDKLSELTFKAVELEKEFHQVREKLSSEDNKKLTIFIDELKQSVQ